MEILGYITGVLIGISLGLLGSGGSILTVPVLVYLMGVNPLLATTSSLFIVGFTSLFGGIRAFGNKQIDFRAVTEFGLPSIFSIFMARHYILPALPLHFFSIGMIQVSRDTFLMMVFAVLMFIAAVSMIKNYDSSIPFIQKRKKQDKVLPLVLSGLTVGLITGLLGAGGGFLIIPSLVLLLRLPMKRAIGTSLFIIAINSLFGFLFSLSQFSFDWPLLILFTLLAIGGLVIGNTLGDKIPSAALKKIFGWFVLVMGTLVIIKELFIQ